MKRMLILIFILTMKDVNAQMNLVPNPSFEDTVACPDSLEELSNSKFWFSCRSTPDYFNECSSASGNSSVGIPVNSWGFQNAFDGKAYVAFGTYDGQGHNYREFIGVQLKDSLVIGETYYLSAYFSRCNSFLTNGASNKVGFRFTKNNYSVSNPAPIDNFANVYTDSIITDSIHWVKISGSFNADSSYNYLIIGNFFDDQSTTVVDDNGFGAGYYLDAVCVTNDSLFNENWTNTYSVNNSDWYNLFPNPVNNILYIKKEKYKTIRYQIYNSIGVEVFNGVLNDNMNIEEVNLSNICNGIYFFRYIDLNIVKKIIIEH